MPDNTSIIVKEGTTEIKGSAFYGCSSLASIEIPNSVTSIGESAFEGCSGLKEVHISNISAWCNIDFKYGNSNPLYYAKNLYLNKELLTNLVIPTDVTAIKDYAFYNCNSLASITIPNSVTSIGNSVFYGCSSLTSIEIPNSVTTIGNSAFSGCSSLASIEIPNSVTTIGNYAFKGCSNLQDVYLSNLTAWCKIDFCEAGTSYNSSLFYNNNLYLNGEDITNLEIPEGVERVGAGSFYARKNIDRVYIPESVTTVGAVAFYTSENISAVYCESSVPATMEYVYRLRTYYYAFTSNAYSYATLYVPTGAKDAYAAAEGWSQFKNIVEMDFTAINDINSAAPATTDACIYDLNGRRVSNPTKGIYIVNGKKVVF